MIRKGSLNEIEEVLKETEKEYYEGFAYKKDDTDWDRKLIERELIDEIEYWYKLIDKKKVFQTKKVYKTLADKLIKLI